MRPTTETFYTIQSDTHTMNNISQRPELVATPQLQTPVALIIFNRPYTTKKVFAEIARARPQKLLIIADGPRFNHPEDARKCADVRAIVNDVDWDCEVLTSYSDINMGCKLRVSSGLDWVFNMVEEAIILEDDCVPHPTFFRFCEEMLDKYRHDDRIAMVSGDNFQFGKKRTEHSYYFSRYTHIWGWASWRRAWEKYDVDMKTWPESHDDELLHKWLGDKKAIRYWEKIFEKVYKGKIDTWDYQWLFACWVQGALTILPNVNLVSNIGFTPEATHATYLTKFDGMKTESMRFPISYPKHVSHDFVADSITEKTMYSGQPLLPRAINKLKQIYRNLYIP